MKRKLPLVASIIAASLVSIMFFSIDQKKVKPEVRKLPRVERKKARSDYFFNKLKDPKTNKIPGNVRARETAFASNLVSNSRIRPLGDAAGTHEWAELGPSDVGGRTRALALDVRNSDIVMAAGVSGGIWKSTDGGNTWAPKLPNGSNLSISFLAQDPVNNNVWYATTGEVYNSTASDKGSTANYTGAGMYKSTDNGESWSLMTYVYDSNNLAFDKEAIPNTDIVSNSEIFPFSITSKVLIHDFSGVSTIFVCSYSLGIWFSSDGGQSFKRFGGSLTNSEYSNYADIVIDDNDNITLWFGPTDSSSNGFFRSLDGGNTFSSLTPPDYSIAGSEARCILALAPSQQSTVYAFLYDNPGSGEQNHFYFFDFSSFDSGGSATFANRSSNLPTFERSDFGGVEEFSTQGGYDMTLAVHPTDPNFVVLGYVNLIKSEDGFATDISGNAAKFWIGGNENPDRQDEQLEFGKTHHADQHILFFDPNNPNTLWSGHDGGISKTSNVTVDRVIWESKNNDYNVTQYYTVSIARDKDKTEVVGGTQDNGTPLLETAGFSGELVPSLTDLSSGDGSFCFSGSTVSYVSSQEGNVEIYGDGYFGSTKRDLTVLFIHPFAVDPNDEGTIYYTSNGDGILARNTSIDDAVNQDNPSLVESGWEDININNAIAMSAIKVSDQNPSHKLYFGGLVSSSPFLFSWEDANTSPDESNMVTNDLSSDIAIGSWLNDIAINPTDGNEIVLVYSNYNITGLFHSLDGGATLTAIEGNLGLNDDQGASGFTGPSMRAAEIVVDWQGKEKYYVATSIGLYYTETLAGNNTEWTLETSLLNNVVIEDLDSRPSDNTIVAGTHGRGIFIGQKFNLTPVAEDQSFELDENASKNSAVGSVVFAEPEGDDVFITILEGNTSDTFSVDNTGAIMVNDSTALDFEINPTFTLSISINDGEASVVTAVTINLKDINDAPKIENQAFDVDENSLAELEIGTVVSADQDGDVPTYSITAGNEDNFFSIEEASGLVKVNNEASLDFEDKSTFELTVHTSDGNLSQEATLTISLNDVNEAPEISDQTFETDEGLDNGFVVATVVATDPENDGITYSLKSGNTDDAFSINENTGAITISDMNVLEFDVNPTFFLVVEISDAELTAEATIIISLIEVILSIEEGFLNSIKVYPNPARNILNVDLSLLQQENMIIELTNMLGQGYLLFEGLHAGEFQRDFDLSNFSKGYYILNFKYSDKQISKKLIIR